MESAEQAAMQARFAAELAGKKARLASEAAKKKLEEVDLEKLKEEVSVRARAAADAAAEKVRAVICDVPLCADESMSPPLLVFRYC